MSGAGENFEEREVSLWMKEMNMRISLTKMLALGILALAALIGLAVAAQDGARVSPQGKSLIEVGGGRIAYVPRTTQYVTLNGRIMRVVKFSQTLSSVEKDCKCPTCCGDSCYIIVFTDAMPGSGPLSGLWILWVAC